MQFAISAKHEVRSVNPRREMHGEERVIAVDVQLVGFLDIDQLPPILGVESAAELKGTLWDADTGDVTLPDVVKIATHSDTRFEGLNATIAGKKLTDTIARKFSGAPVNGGLEITWTLTLPHPEGSTIGQLSEKIGETVKVTAESAQGALDLGGEDANADAEATT